MPLTSQTEIERKYDVDATTPMPDLAGVAGVVRVTGPETVTLRAIYFDTDDLALARNRIALRRREGGADAGWHLKLPAELGRTEIQTALTSDDRVPAALRENVEVFLRGRPVSPLAGIETRRTVRELVDADGSPMVELADDEVIGSDLRRGTSRTWHEWEAELAGGHTSAAILDQVESVLLETGARPSRSGSKLAHALGADRLGDEFGGVSNRGTAPGTLGPLVSALEACDPRVRRDDTESCHDMRTTVRRLRSALAAVDAPDLAAVESVRDELRRLGSLLGEARDLEVRSALAGRLHRDADARLRENLVLSFAGEYSAAHGLIVAYLNGTAYFQLLDALEALVENSEPSAGGLQHALAGACTNVRKQASYAMDRGRVPRLADLHRLRKGARRLRYLAEALQGLGADDEGAVAADTALRSLIAAARDTQDTLGDHRDLVLFADSARLASTESARSGSPTGSAEAYLELAGRAETAAASLLTELPRSVGDLLLRIAGANAVLGVSSIATE